MNRSNPSSDASTEAARRSSEVLARLQKDLRNKRLAIIVGAGVTLSATADASGKPLSRITWTGLIENGLDFLVSEGYVSRLNSEITWAYEALLNPDTDSLLNAADILSNQLKQHGQFPTWLQSVFGSLDRDVRHPAILEALKYLHQNGAILLTTNYDDVLETYCGLRYIGRSKIEDIVRFRGGDLDGVFHVHGSYHDPQEVVLNTTDYYQIKKSDEVQNMLKAFLDDKTIMFVGCGSGLEDPNFDGLLKWGAERQKNIPNKHCLLVRDGDSLICKQLLRLKYGSNYHDLAPYLKKLLHDSPAGYPQILAQNASEATTRPTRAPSSTVPFSRDPDFVDRPDILAWIHDKCARPAARAALVGLGGVGKSQLAIQYSYQARETSPQTWVFWVHGSTNTRFEEAYRGIADRLELPGRHDPKANVLQLVRDWLCDEANGRWTMVLDNVDDVEVFYPRPSRGSSSPLAAYLPQSHNGSILITSRSRDAAAKLTGSYKNVKEVQAMDTSQALQLLRNKLEDNLNEDGAADLLDALNHIPLAITQAAAYINRRGPRMTIAGYLKEFQKNDWKKANLLNRDAGDLRRDRNASHSVITTWQISFEQIREERRSAADLLSLMSFFNPQGIPESVLRSHARNVVEVADEEDTNGEFDDDIDTLRAYSLVTVTAESDMCEMHRLVQFCTRVWLSSVDDVENWRQKFCMLMSSEFPMGEFETWPKCQQLLPHAESLFDYVPADEVLLKEWATLLTHVASYMWGKGSYTAAENTVLKAISAREKTLGPEDLDTLISVGNLAVILGDQGKYKEAELMNRRALEGREKALGKEHPSTLTSVGNLASGLQNQGKYKEAELMNRRVLEGRENTLGMEHADTLASVNNLALILKYHGGYDEAELLNRRALKGYEKALGKEHPSTLTSVDNLASVLRDQGKYEEAEPLNRRALKGYEKALGKEHPSTLTSVDNLASVLRDQGKYEEAEFVSRRALEGRENALGREHADTLTSINNLGLILQYQEKHDEAEPLYRRALKGLEKALGKEHPYTLTSVDNLASVLRDQGKYEEAEPLNRRALKGYEKSLGKEHPSTLTSVSNLASVLQYQGNNEEAEPLNRRALKGYEKALGKEHTFTLTIVDNLAMTLESQGKNEEAELMSRRALEGRENALGKEHPETRMSVNKLAFVLRQQGKYEEAELMNRRALEGSENALAKESKCSKEVSEKLQENHD